MADVSLSSRLASNADTGTAIASQDADVWTQLTIPAIVRKKNTITVASSTSRNKGYADYTCDGTDDHTDINTALGDLPATGGTVELLEGIYNLGDSVTITGDNSRLIGQGSGDRKAGNDGGTILRAVTGFAGTELVKVDNGGGTRPVAYVHLQDFVIDGDSIGASLVGLLYKSYRGNIRNVDATMCTGVGVQIAGVSTWNTYDTHIIGLRSYFNTSHGLELQSGATDILASNVMLFSNSGSGLVLAAGGNVFANTHCYDNTLHGIHFNSGGDLFHLSNSKVENSRQHGIYFDNAAAGYGDVLIDNVDFRRNGRGGSSNQYDHIHFDHNAGNSIARVVLSNLIFRADSMNNTADKYLPGYCVQADGTTCTDLRISNVAVAASSTQSGTFDIWNGTRSMLNGMGRGGTVPGSSSWSGYEQEGMHYLNTATNIAYIYANSGWRQLN